MALALRKIHRDVVRYIGSLSYVTEAPDFDTAINMAELTDIDRLDELYDVLLEHDEGGGPFEGGNIVADRLGEGEYELLVNTDNPHAYLLHFGTPPTFAAYRMMVPGEEW